MRTSGYTLVELMITVAIIGISAAIIGGAAQQARLTGLVELQRERALLLLEYHARCAAEGRATDPQVVERLVESLPDTQVHAQAERGLTTLTVQWRPPLGLPQRRSLAVFTGEAAP